MYCDLRVIPSIQFRWATRQNRDMDFEISLHKFSGQVSQLLSRAQREERFDDKQDAIQVVEIPIGGEESSNDRLDFTIGRYLERLQILGYQVINIVLIDCLLSCRLAQPFPDLAAIEGQVDRLSQSSRILIGRQ